MRQVREADAVWALTLAALAALLGPWWVAMPLILLAGVAVYRLGRMDA